MKQITQQLKNNFITVMGSIILISAFLSIVICFAYSYLNDSNLIAHIALNN